jgi:S1-C subfamily serine protease
VSARRRLIAALAAAGALALGLAACGGGETLDSTTESDSDSGTAATETEQIVVSSPSTDFNPADVYEKAAPGVVTVLSIFGDGGADAILGGGAGQGSGFVVSDDGEIVTNAHVVTSGGAGNGGGQPKQASEVYVEFSDRNRVPAEVVGFDPDADVALIKVDPGEIELNPIPISERDEYAVGEPVAAIGSPFGERQSLSVGIVSAVDRSIQSLTPFAIDNAIQTDASINPGNSGGPLLDADGNVIGINQQIESASGTNSGVGFAIPVSALRFSLDQLREDGSVDYAYIGVSTQGLWPQLADELDIDANVGALISDVVPNGPADEAGLKGSDGEREFQGAQVSTGGDVIVAVDGKRLEHESDLAELISRQRPGDTVTLEILREGRTEEIEVELAERPDRVARQG